MVGFARARRRVFDVARLSGCDLLVWMPLDDVKVGTPGDGPRGRLTWPAHLLRAALAASWVRLLLALPGRWESYHLA